MAKKKRARRNNNPTHANVAGAARLSRDFHGQDDSVQVTRVKHPQIHTAMVVGKLDAVLYTTPAGERFKHDFRLSSRPVLIASGDGAQLAIVGGRYRMTGRGIVDH